MRNLRWVGLLAALIVSTPLAAQNLQAGKGLWELQCQSCHHATLPLREKQIVKSYEGLIAEVYRWGSELKLDWSAEEYRNVTNYLDWEYYKFRGHPGETPAE